MTYGTKQGLSQLAVNAIVKDAQGFIWVGTQNGLNQFDGNHFKIFRNDAHDNASVSHNYISKLLIDSKDRLWVITSSGLDQYDFKHQKFIRHAKGKFDKSFFDDIFVWSLKEGANDIAK
ncbi:ligand-binding sensor domain-containing protein [Aliikangiella maris]|uniref:Two-component regulator propeller domain-containing protein n=2 Tax=Aliikangiella maris TaxID=3162458 RepID=A0ABV3MSM6_9GAMM